MAEPKITLIAKLIDGISGPAQTIRGKLRGLGTEAKSLLSNALVQGVGLAGLIAGLKSSWNQADQLEASMRRLRATAKLTGVPLSELEAIAATARSSFRLSTTSANDYAIELAKLAGKAGDVGQAAPALAAFLDIGAARGLSAEQTLQAVRQAILGIDEGTDKLFNKNPSVLYAEYAAQIGTTAGKLSDQQKAQALLTAALQDGVTVQGEYGNYLRSNAGLAEQQAIATQEAAVKLGQATESIRHLLLPVLTSIAQGFSDFIGGIQLLAVDAGIAFQSITPKVQEMAGKVLLIMSGLIGESRAVLTLFGDSATALADRLGDSGVRMVRDSEQQYRNLETARSELYAEITGISTTGEARVTGAAAAGGSARTTLTQAELDAIEAARKKHQDRLNKLAAEFAEAVEGIATDARIRELAGLEEHYRAYQEASDRFFDQLGRLHATAVAAGTESSEDYERATRNLTDAQLANTRAFGDGRLAVRNLWQEQDRARPNVVALKDETALLSTSQLEAKASSDDLKLKVQAASTTMGEALGTLATNIGGVGESAHAAIEHVEQLVLSIGKIASGDTLGGIAGGIGALKGLADMFTGESESSRRVRVALETTSSKLEEARRTIGDLVQLQVPGRQLSGAEAALRTFLAQAGDRPRLNPADLGRALTGQGLTLADLEEVAKTFGIDLSPGGRLNRVQLAGLLSILQEQDPLRFREDFAGQSERIRRGVGIGAIGDEFGATTDLLAREDIGAPALAALLEGIDTRTQEGRQGGIGQLQDLFNSFGSLTREQQRGLLGNLTGQQFLSTIERLIELLGTGIEDLPAFGGGVVPEAGDTDDGDAGGPTFPPRPEDTVESAATDAAREAAAAASAALSETVTASFELVLQEALLVQTQVLQQIEVNTRSGTGRGTTVAIAALTVTVPPTQRPGEALGDALDRYLQAQRIDAQQAVGGAERT